MKKEKASAWYIVTYDQKYNKEEDELHTFDVLLSFPWVVHDILIEIKRESMGIVTLNIVKFIKAL